MQLSIVYNKLNWILHLHSRTALNTTFFIIAITCIWHVPLTNFNCLGFRIGMSTIYSTWILHLNGRPFYCLIMSWKIPQLILCHLKFLGLGTYFGGKKPTKGVQIHWQNVEEVSRLWMRIVACRSVLSKLETTEGEWCTWYSSQACQCVMSGCFGVWSNVIA